MYFPTMRFELLAHCDPQRWVGLALLDQPPHPISLRWFGPMLSPTETLKRCKTPAPQCSAAGAVSAGWAGGYCPSQGTLGGEQGGHPGVGRTCWAKTAISPTSVAGKLGPVWRRVKGAEGGRMVVMRREWAWDGVLGLKRNRGGSCPKAQRWWGQGWLFPCS